MADLAPESVLLCEWCDEEIDAIDVSVEAFEVMGAPCCAECFTDRNSFKLGKHSHTTTCIETIGGDPETALRLSFQIKVF
jgi:hypothetical protein